MDCKNECELHLLGFVVSNPPLVRTDQDQGLVQDLVQDLDQDLVQDQDQDLRPPEE